MCPYSPYSRTREAVPSPTLGHGATPAAARHGDTHNRYQRSWTSLAQGEFAVGVDAVAADAEVLADTDALPYWHGAGPGVPGGLGGAAADGPVRPAGVVVGGEGIQLGLQPTDGGGGVLAGEPVLEGLVQSLDLAAGLRVVGPAVAVGDPQRGELAFERDPAAAPVEAGKDSTIEFLSGVKCFGWGP